MKLEVFKFSEKIFEVEVPLIELESGAEIFIGRADDCHIVLDDHQISRHHAVLNLVEGALKLRKLSSFGDLNVNGIYLDEASLNEGDKFSIQDFTLYPKNFNVVAQNNEEGLIDEPTAIFTSSPDELEDDIPEPEVSEEATEILTSLEQAQEDEDESEPDDSQQESSFNDEFGNESSESEDFEQEPEEFSEPEGFDQSDEEEGFGEVDSFGGDDEMFSDDSGFEGDAGGDSTQVFQSFANYYLVIDGEYAPFDKYKIEDNETFIGRDPEKCQIVLNDPEVSTNHALIKKSLVNCSIEDLNSSNGTLFNGERINKAELSNNDNFQVGSTIFTVKVTSDLIESEKDMLMPVDSNQEVEVEEIVEEEVDYDEMNGEDADAYSLEEAQEKSFIKRIWKDPKKRKIVIVLALVFAVLSLMEEEEPATKKVSKKAEQKVEKEAETQTKNFSDEVLGKLEENYALALSKYESGEYYEAKEYLEIIRAIDPSYKDTETLRKLVKQGHEELLKLKAEEEAEKERKKRELRIKGLLERARASVEKREVAVSESLFGQILEIDPENMEVPQLKLEIEAFQAQERKKREEEQIKKALRKAMVDALQPGKTLFLKEEWYKAIDRLLKFTKKKGIDEDLMNEATKMLKEAKRSLSAQINPLLGRARSHKEGQDLKRAYETYGEVLKFDPSNEEALTEREQIYDSLRTRSMKVYREALISESLSLFDEAREKFEEVQQISPVNSEYYNKATERLKNYLE